METVQFKIPTKDIHVFKSAARELDIDLVVETDNVDGWHECYALVESTTTVVCLSYIAGTSAMYAGVMNPLNEMMSGFEKTIQKHDNEGL